LTDLHQTEESINQSLKTVAHGASIIFFGMIIGKILGTINQILLARILGPEDFGLFNLGFSLFMVFSIIGMFGMRSGISRFVSIYYANKDQSRLKGTVHFGLQFNLTISLFIASFLFLFADFISNTIFHKPDLESILKSFAFALPFGVLLNTLVAITRGAKEAKYKVYTQEIGMRVIRITTFMILAYFGHHLFGALIAFIIATTSMFFYLLYITQIRITRIFHNPIAKSSVAKPILSFSWPLTLSSFVLIFMTQTDQIVLGLYQDADDIGIYQAAHGVAYLIGFILPAFGFLFFPIISELYSKKDFNGISKIYTSITKWIFMINFPLFLVIILFPGFFILLLYGDEYSEGRIALVILAIGVIVNTSVGLVGMVLNGIGKTKLTLVSDVSGSLTNIILNFVLIPSYGIIGAAIATSFSLALRNLLAIFFVRKNIEISPYNISFFKIGGFNITTAICIFLSWLYLTNLFPDRFHLNVYSLSFEPVITFILIILYISICYIALIKFKWIDEQDKLILIRIKEKVPIGKNLIEKIL
jgi:O-antigen/teichoic acid export membrane protein